jgi:peptidoglycan-associated lipoprotein
MRRMKTTTLALVLAAALAACSKDKPKTTPPVPDSPTTTGQTEAPAPDVSQDQQVSPSLSVSGDIATACGLKIAPSQATPKFDYDKDDLTAEDRAVLDQIAQCLTSGALKGRAVSLIGRADPRGTEEYNLGLGSRRAHSVSQYLGRLGVQPPQMGVTTRGALDATGMDEDGWREDRRVDIQLQPSS